MLDIESLLEVVKTKRIWTDWVGWPDTHTLYTLGLRLIGVLYASTDNSWIMYEKVQITAMWNLLTGTDNY